LLFLISATKAYEFKNILNFVVSQRKTNLDSAEILDMTLGSIGFGVVNSGIKASGVEKKYYKHTGFTRQFGSWSNLNETGIAMLMNNGKNGTFKIALLT
tara:strand:+ start:37 stop:333 length:297 start_codon:yes stop_codon:yes gene_type:complete